MGGASVHEKEVRILYCSPTECDPVVGGMIWDHEVACSSHVTPTKRARRWLSRFCVKLIIGGCYEEQKENFLFEK